MNDNDNFNTGDGFQPAGDHNFNETTPLRVDDARHLDLLPDLGRDQEAHHEEAFRATDCLSAGADLDSIEEVLDETPSDENPSADTAGQEPDTSVPPAESSGTAGDSPSTGKDAAAQNGTKRFRKLKATRTGRASAQPGTLLPSPKPADLPEFTVGPGTIAPNIDDAQTLLAATGRYFLRNGSLMTITESPDGSVQLREAERRQVLIELDSSARWNKVMRDGSGTTRTTPPAHVCDGVLRPVRPGNLGTLNAVAYQPFFRPDGTLVTTPGYDTASGIYAHFQPALYPIPARPTDGQAKHALDALLEILQDVAFAHPGAKAATLGAMLTAAVRPALDGAPLFLVRAPAAGTGKTYLTELISLFATPGPAAMFTYPRSSEECGKVILAALRTAPPVINFDNTTENLAPHKDLCSILTAEHYNGRLQRTSTIVPVGTRTLFMASGNNVDVLGDMTRRTVTIDLDARSELPMARTYRDANLKEHCRERRHELVTAALTLIQAGVASERGPGELRPVASFGRWSALCRMPLVLQGLEDPAASMFRAIEDDPLRSQVGRMLRVLYEHFGDGPTPCADMIKRAHDATIPRSRELLEVMQEALGAPRIDAVRLGRWLRAHEGQLVGELRLTRAPVTRSSVQWVVQKTTPTS